MFSVGNMTRRISLWPVSYQRRDYFSNLMHFAAFARAIVCSVSVNVLLAERRSQVGGSRLCSKMKPGSNLSAETGCPDWCSAFFNESAGESRDDASNQSMIGSFHVLSLSLFINHKETTLKTWA